MSDLAAEIKAAKEKVIAYERAKREAQDSWQRKKQDEKQTMERFIEFFTPELRKVGNEHGIAFHESFVCMGTENSLPNISWQVFCMGLDYGKVAAQMNSLDEIRLVGGFPNNHWWVYCVRKPDSWDYLKVNVGLRKSLHVAMSLDEIMEFIESKKAKKHFTENLLQQLPDLRSAIDVILQDAIRDMGNASVRPNA